MQHDTSPHDILVGGQKRRYQCASLVLCYSRMIYARLYRRWSRMECRIFLSEALAALGGAAEDCMIDNSSVIIARGNGANAVAAEEMQALGRRFGFRFVAHELGDANRSARVERPFSYIERNFYPGRTFTGDDDLNEQMAAWCDRVNRKHRRSLKAAPIELWAAEKPALRALPLHIPEVHDVHARRVDVEGYVNLHTNRYSVPAVLIGRQVEVRETARRIRIYDGHRMLAEPPRAFTSAVSTGRTTLARDALRLLRGTGELFGGSGELLGRPGELGDLLPQVLIFAPNLRETSSADRLAGDQGEHSVRPLADRTLRPTGRGRRRLRGVVGCELGVHTRRAPS